MRLELQIFAVVYMYLGAS